MCVEEWERGDQKKKTWKGVTIIIHVTQQRD